MPRGPCWSQQEVGRLLAQIGGSRAVALLMASTSRPNEALWRDIARRLSAEGFQRSVSQCRAKWKKLKQCFYSDWASRRRGGAQQALCAPAHYRTMKRLWKAAGRPVFGVRRLPVYSLGMIQVKDEEVDDDEEEEEILRPSSATMPWDMRSSEEQGGLSCPELSPMRQGGHSLSGFRSPISEDQYSYLYNSAEPPASALPLTKSEPQDCTTEFQASSSPLSRSESVFSHLLSMKQETLDQGTELVTEQDQDTLSSMPGEEAELEDPGLEDPGAASDLQGPAVVSLLQNMQQILAQLLHTSQQQQVLLESLASDTVSHLHLISDNLVHVGETLHELLVRVHNCDEIQ